MISIESLNWENFQIKELIQETVKPMSNGSMKSNSGIIMYHQSMLGTYVHNFR